MIPRLASLLGVGVRLRHVGGRAGEDGNPTPPTAAQPATAPDRPTAAALSIRLGARYTLATPEIPSGPRTYLGEVLRNGALHRLGFR